MRVLSEVRVLSPKVHDQGSFIARRILPSSSHPMVGPFVFFDHLGPSTFAPGQGLDVRPHPHIGLATVTYLFEGALMHRDSLGIVQRITPGSLAWMTSGRGIVHSERTPPEERATGFRMNAIQLWVALPKSHEQTEPGFFHHPKATLPVVSLPGVRLHVLLGSSYGQTSPVKTFSPTLYLAGELDAGAVLRVPPDYEQRAVYSVEGAIRVDGQPLPPQHLALLEAGAEVRVEASTASRIIVLGGAPLDGTRLLWWNLVASDPVLIEEAKARWAAQQFPPVPGETEFIPLPTS
jgi:redox-sensitive bicupin YhaK (pirin superfamily)